MKTPRIYRTVTRHVDLPEGGPLQGVAFSLVEGKKFRPNRMKETWKTNEQDGEINRQFYEVELSGPVQSVSGGDLKTIGRRWFATTGEGSGFPQEFFPCLFSEDDQ